MVNHDIIAGLRNALNRGENLKKAASSLINAGYNKSEVKTAVSIVSRPAAKMPKIVPTQKQLTPLPGPAVMPSVQRPVAALTSVKKVKSKGLIISGIVGISFVMLFLFIWLLAILFG